LADPDLLNFLDFSDFPEFSGFSVFLFRIFWNYCIFLGFMFTRAIVAVFVPIRSSDKFPWGSSESLLSTAGLLFSAHGA
jgi:hypothetical protein